MFLAVNNGKQWTPQDAEFDDSPMQRPNTVQEEEEDGDETDDEDTVDDNNDDDEDTSERHSGSDDSSENCKRGINSAGR
mgnify:CR=1 FL=1